jgi:hypothetical protein
MPHPNILLSVLFRVLEGGFAGAAVLISFGVILGKTNPLQLLVETLLNYFFFVKMPQ